jgi:Phytanoyl-CoA dioxygenase (PhyH)
MMQPAGLISRLNEVGFLIVDLLKEQDIAYLNQLCDRYLLSAQTDFVSSSHLLDISDSDFINSELHRIVLPVFSKIFPELQLLGGTLATKVTGNAVLSAHQDWSIVDESRFRSYNLWIPLVDTNRENGTLGMVPGSHRWTTSVRGLNIPNPFEKFTGQITSIGHEPDLKAGQAILYDHRLVHYSRPNQTSRRRNTAIIGVKDKQAELRVSFCLDGKAVQTYAVDETAFYRFDPEAVRAGYLNMTDVPLPGQLIQWPDIMGLYLAHVTPEFKQELPLGEPSWFRRFLNKFAI